VSIHAAPPYPRSLYADALESWTFLDLAGKRPLFMSPFGDVFFQTDSGSGSST
jgi:hypothetical protein